MQPLRNIAVSILVLTLFGLALVALPSTTSSQNIGSPNERTSTGGVSQRSRGPQTRFVKKGSNKIPNRYIVVLNDDVVGDDNPREARLERVTQIANSHALAHAGKVDYIYETALKGYAIELPNEAAAVAISRMPKVQWVEEDEFLETAQAPVSPQPSPPWGLDVIDGSFPLAAAPNPTNSTTNGIYQFNGNGTGVDAYVIDSGINTAHVAFGPPPFASRATQAADCIRNVDCRTGPASPFTDQFCGSGGPNTTNNDCVGHGTHMAGTIGGNTYGVAKAVNIKSIKVCFASVFPVRGALCASSAVISGVNFVTDLHRSDSSVPKVINMSLGLPNNACCPPDNNPSGVASAVNFAINNGITVVVAAGNDNRDASRFTPASVAAALTVGAVDWFGNRPAFSNWGPGIDLWAPGVLVLSAKTGLGGSPATDCAFWDGTNSDECRDNGTSMAAAHVSGAVAMYLQGRTGLSNCGSFPIDGPAPHVGANLSTCPDRVGRFLKANANLDKLSDSINGILRDANDNIVLDPLGNTIPVVSPDRFLWNISVPSLPNPLENHRFFIWTQYADFLSREPDNGGMQFYVTLLNGCTVDQECIKVYRGLISANFFRSPEFGGRGGYVANLFNIVFGQRPKTPQELSDPAKVERPHYNEFVADLQFISAPTDAEVNVRKTALALAWLGRQEVVDRIGNLSPADFVLKLETTAGGVTLANRQALIDSIIANNNTQTRAAVLRAVAESPEVTNKFTLQNFVTMQYIGHLRREPEDCHNSPDPPNCGYIFHYNRFGTGGDPHEIENLITRGFIESPEYRRRFGP